MSRDSMKRISVSASTEDHEAFRRSAQRTKRPIAQLIREAMAFYREERLEEKSRPLELPALVGHRPLSNVPGRVELHDEIFGDETTSR